MRIGTMSPDRLRRSMISGMILKRSRSKGDESRKKSVSLVVISLMILRLNTPFESDRERLLETGSVERPDHLAGRPGRTREPSRQPKDGHQAGYASLPPIIVPSTLMLRRSSTGTASGLADIIAASPR